MAVTAFWYSQGLANTVGGTAAAAGGTAVDWLSDTIMVSLHLDYSPSQFVHALWSDVSASEIAATGGYSAGGSALQTKTLAVSNGTVTYDGADQTYAASTISATQAVIYDASIAGSVLLAYVDFGGTVSSSGGNWAITWDAAGILQNVAA